MGTYSVPSSTRQTPTSLPGNSRQRVLSTTFGEASPAVSAETATNSGSSTSAFGTLLENKERVTSQLREKAKETASLTEGLRSLSFVKVVLGGLVAGTISGVLMNVNPLITIAMDVIVGFLETRAVGKLASSDGKLAEIIRGLSNRFSGLPTDTPIAKMNESDKTSSLSTLSGITTGVSTLCTTLFSYLWGKLSPRVAPTLQHLEHDFAAAKGFSKLTSGLRLAAGKIEELGPVRYLKSKPALGLLFLLASGIAWGLCEGRVSGMLTSLFDRFKSASPKQPESIPTPSTGTSPLAATFRGQHRAYTA